MTSSSRNDSPKARERGGFREWCPVVYRLDRLWLLCFDFYEIDNVCLDIRNGELVFDLSRRIADSTLQRVPTRQKNPSAPSRFHRSLPLIMTQSSERAKRPSAANSVPAQPSLSSARSLPPLPALPAQLDLIVTQLEKMNVLSGKKRALEEDSPRTAAKPSSQVSDLQILALAAYKTSVPSIQNMPDFSHGIVSQATREELLALADRANTAVQSQHHALAALVAFTENVYHGPLFKEVGEEMRKLREYSDKSTKMLATTVDKVEGETEELVKKSAKLVSRIGGKRGSTVAGLIKEEVIRDPKKAAAPSKVTKDSRAKEAPASEVKNERDSRFTESIAMKPIWTPADGELIRRSRLSLCLIASPTQAPFFRQLLPSPASSTPPTLAPAQSAQTLWIPKDTIGNSRAGMRCTVFALWKRWDAGLDVLFVETWKSYVISLIWIDDCWMD